VRTAAGEDLYITLLAADPATGEVTLHVFINPLVAWIWIGGGVVAIGGIFAAWPDRRRREAAAEGREASALPLGTAGRAEP